MMKGLIKDFRRGKRTSQSDQVIAKFKEIESRAKGFALMGRKAFWKSPKGKTIKGKVLAAHGDNGALRIKMEKRLPASALSSSIWIK